MEEQAERFDDGILSEDPRETLARRCWEGCRHSRLPEKLGAVGELEADRVQHVTTPGGRATVTGVAY